MTGQLPNDDGGKPAGVLALVLATAAVATAFFLVEHNHAVSLNDLLDPDSANIELAAAEGSIQRRIGFGLLLATGLSCLAASRRQSFRVHGFLGGALVAYLAWCIASTSWSADFSLAIRRVSALICFTAGAIGVGRCFTLRQLCVMGVSAAGIYLLIGLGDELYHGFFQPGSPDYRFTGHVHPNLQASYCAAICLGALCLMDRPGAARLALSACAAIAFVFLLLTKSRTATLAFLAGCAVVGAYRLSSRQLLVLGLSAAWFVSAAILAASVYGVDVPRALWGIVLINRTDDAISLTGRVPLWQHLLGLIDDRILIGFGYGSFWTPQHIRSASAVVGSGISHAHCGYLEIVLNLGLVGLAIYLLAFGSALRGALLSCRARAETGALFLAALLCFAVVHSAAEALFATASFLPFIVACGMWRMAFGRVDSTAPADIPASAEKGPTFGGWQAAGSSQA